MQHWTAAASVGESWMITEDLGTTVPVSEEYVPVWIKAQDFLGSSSLPFDVHLLFIIVTTGAVSTITAQICYLCMIGCEYVHLYIHDS